MASWILISGGSVIDGTGAQPIADCSVLVKDDEIVGVGAGVGDEIDPQGRTRHPHRRLRQDRHAGPDRRPLPHVLRRGPDAGGAGPLHQPRAAHPALGLERDQGPALGRYRDIRPGGQLLHRCGHPRGHRRGPHPGSSHDHRGPVPVHQQRHKRLLPVVGGCARLEHRQGGEHRRRDGHRGPPPGQERRRPDQDRRQPDGRHRGLLGRRDQGDVRRCAPPQQVHHDARPGLQQRGLRGGGRARLDHARQRHAGRHHRAAGRVTDPAVSRSAAAGQPRRVRRGRRRAGPQAQRLPAPAGRHRRVACTRPETRVSP